MVLKSFQRSNWCPEICSSRRKPRKDREGLGYRPQPPTQRALPTYPWPSSPWHTARPLSQHFLFRNYHRFGCPGSSLLCVDSSLQRVNSLLQHRLSLVVTRGLSCPAACGILVPRPGAKPPTSPALQAGFLTTGPPGRPSTHVFLCFKQVHVFSPHPQASWLPWCLIHLALYIVAANSMFIEISWKKLACNHIWIFALKWGDLDDDLLLSPPATQEEKELSKVSGHYCQQEAQDRTVKGNHFFIQLAFIDPNHHQVFIWQLPCGWPWTRPRSKWQNSIIVIDPGHLLCARHCPGC